MARYYFTANGETVHGPIDEGTLLEAYRKGTLTGATQICQEGFQGWRSLSSLEPKAQVESGSSRTANPTGSTPPGAPTVTNVTPPRFKIPFPLGTILTIAYIVWGVYFAWTETGPYGWLVHLVAWDGSYDKTSLGLIVFFPWLVGFVLLGAFSLPHERYWKPFSVLLLSFPCLAIAAHVSLCIHGLVTRAQVDVAPNIKEAAAATGFLPHEVKIRQFELLRLQGDRGVTITSRKSRSSLDSGLAYVPFSKEAWPEALTPVVLIGNPETLKKRLSTGDLVGTMQKLPLPALVRGREDWSNATFVVAFAPGETVREYWGSQILIYPVIAIMLAIAWFKGIFRGFIKANQ